MATQTVLIKKYENRRLYDATNSRYVNLEEVAQLVQQGYDVQVVDAGSGEDITRLILTQIIAEGAKTSDSNFPLDILRQMVIASGRASQESAVRYTKAMLDLYQSTYKAMVPPISPFDFLQNPLAPAPPTAQPVPAEPVSSNAGSEAGIDDISHLKARLAELEKTMSALAPKTPTRKPKGKPVRKQTSPKTRARKK